ncbi:DUF3800 domain-containing protein [Listeria monocytogenes]|uniref:DUF3800 domain-containing protein n=1 Tax=Listeria monocytogenes TaxID=1639 RepID=UPI00083D3AC8|nr:DUF3800 domain-containing protein [Listeria monocytogenes]EAE8567859.1 DUF3800 domain-containing protein [Listeria monocytogenes]EAF6962952.1 DUF3800 domain-containing protein [Listeria monocytogenes]EAF8119753.1 DUF3800 domain-containing protein [Listeria monocytogenes]EDO0419942.1 DUF3800 domain-containing protein [Listeria monocytogenes]EHF6226490.1 DUF3800 domain-containing protein [Listeria monocytogenes]
MNLYVDESGSITSSMIHRNRFFVLVAIETDFPEKVKRVFRTTKKNFINAHPDYGFDLKNEIKGSEMPAEMKKWFFQDLGKKTDIKIHYMIFDNFKAELRLRKKPSITFNYLIYLKLCSLINWEPVDSLNINLDNRNCSVYNLNSLCDYLEIQFVAKHGLVNNVTVKYHESSDNELIQIADIFANTLFRMCKYSNAKKEHPLNCFNESKEVHAECKDIISNCEFFPREECMFDFVN